MVQEVMDKKLEFNPNDLNQIEWLVENEEKFDMPLSGLNEDGEETLTYITDEYVMVETFQSNGWIRKNYYYTDGYCEEMFERQ